MPHSPSVATAFLTFGRHNRFVDQYLHCESLLAKGRYRDAREAAVEALSRDPENPLLLSALSRSFLGLNEPLQAHSFASQAVAQAPGSADLVALLGLTELAAGSQKKAAETLRNARSIDPDNLYVLQLSVYVLLADPKVKSPLTRSNILLEARAVADGAVSAHPDNARAHITSGRVHLAAKEYAEAEEAARYGLAIEPNNAEALTLLGMATDKQGRTHDAGDFFVQASKADPTSSDALDEMRSMSTGWMILLAVSLLLLFGFLGSIGGPSLLVVPLIMVGAIGGVVVLGDMMTKRSQRKTARKKLRPDAQNILDQDRKLR